MKGVTALIAAILLLLLAIASIALSMGFFTRVTNTAAQAAQNETTETVIKLSKQVTIDNANSTAVYIRNTGSAAISGIELAIYVNNAAVSCNPPMVSIAPNNVQACNFLPACLPGQAIKVTSPSNSAEVTC